MISVNWHASSHIFIDLQNISYKNARLLRLPPPAHQFILAASVAFQLSPAAMLSDKDMNTEATCKIAVFHQWWQNETATSEERNQIRIFHPTQDQFKLHQRS